MKVTKVDHKRGRAGHFTIWVWARDDPLHWKECAYGFAFEDKHVYFLFGGQETDKRLIGSAQGKEEAIKKAEVFLEGWLRECGAID